MSYRSEVSIGLSKDGYNELKKLCNEIDKQSFILPLADRVYINPSKDKVIFQFDNYNHWSSEDNSEKFLSFLKALNDKGFGYNLIALGEEVEDITYDIQYGNNDKEQFQILSLMRVIDTWDDEIWDDIYDFNGEDL